MRVVGPGDSISGPDAHWHDEPPRFAMQLSWVSRP